MGEPRSPQGYWNDGGDGGDACAATSTRRNCCFRCSTTNWNQSQTSRVDTTAGEGCGTYAERSENERAGGCCQGLSPGGDNRAPESGCAPPRAPGAGGGRGEGVDPAACGGCGGCPAMRSNGSHAGVRQTRIHSQLQGHRPRGSVPGQGVVACGASPACVCPAGRLHTLCGGPRGDRNSSGSRAIL